MSKNYPLIFTLPQPVLGNGYVARILVRGRAVLSVEADGSNWINGVQPSAIAGGGETFDEARLKFCEGLHSVFLDIAAEAKSFSDFKKRAEGFFNQPCDAATAKEWDDALVAVRRGEARLDGLVSISASSHVGGIAISQVADRDATPQEDGLCNVAEAA